MTLRAVVLAVIFSVGSFAFAEPLYTLNYSLKTHLAKVQNPAYNATTCPAILVDLQKDLQRISWNNFSNKTLNLHAQETMNLSWKLRLAIHQKLNVVGKDCNLLVREVFPLLRDAEDYLSEFAYAASVFHPENVDFQAESIPIYEHTDSETYFLRPDINERNFSLRSGDVLLARGTSFVSAVISKLADNRSSFSHALIWNADPKTGIANSVEAYLDVGVQQFDADYALKNENVRLTVLRPKNAQMGVRAAAFAMQAAQQSLPYDYKMNFNDTSALSCVEVVTSAYAKASHGQMRLPLYTSQVAVKDKNFLANLGLQSGPLVAPADLETDPNFELILDWRDNRIIRDSRHKDAILYQTLRWMETLHYQFHDNSRAMIAKYVLQPARDTVLWPLLHKLTGANVNSAMPKQTLGLASLMKDVGQVLLTELRERDRIYSAQYNRPMTNEQLRATLEAIRQKDLARYNRGEDSLFHKIFNPN